MKILFLLLLSSTLFAQFKVVGDTTDLKNTHGSGVVFLEEYGKGSLDGGGFFHRIDSTYDEGIHAFGYPYDGYQWARISLIDQYITLGSNDNDVLIWNTSGYTPINQDSLWTLINAGTDSSLNYYGVVITENDNSTSSRVKGKNYWGNDVQDYKGVFYNIGYVDNGKLYTRTLWGGNDSMDVEIQSSNALLISGVMNSPTSPNYVSIASSDSIILQPRAISDALTPSRLMIDRVTKTTRGGSNTSDIEIATNTGGLRVNGTCFDSTGNIGVSYNFATAALVAGTADAITINFTPDFPALVAGLEVKFIAEAANTGAATLAIDGGTAKNIYESSDASALESGDIANGAVVHLLYDGVEWQQISQSGN